MYFVEQHLQTLFLMNFTERKSWYFGKNQTKFVPKGIINSENIGLDNGLLLSRRQAIACSKSDPDL